MLRASGEQFGDAVDLRALADPGVAPGVPAGQALLAFTDALIVGVGDVHGSRRTVVEQVGAEGAAGAATVAGNFEMMNRLVDGSGVPIPARHHAIATDIGVRHPLDVPGRAERG